MYALVDYKLPTGAEALTSCEAYNTIDSHPIWHKIRLSVAAQGNSFAPRAVAAWLVSRNDNLVQYIKFVAATLSDAPMYDFQLLLAVLRKLDARFKERAASLASLPRFISAPRQREDNSPDLMSLFMTYAPLHFKPEMRLKGDGDMIESAYPDGVTLIWAFEFLLAKFDSLFREAAGKLFADSEKEPPLCFASDSSVMVGLTRVAESQMENAKEKCFRIISEVVVAYVKQLNRALAFAEQDDMRG